MPSHAEVEHLLRRTEFAARPQRIAELVALPSLEAAVDDVLAVPADPGSVVFTQESDWQRGEELIHYWFDRMAHDSPRPIQEKMAFFWHGHFCSSRSKVGSTELMREQIDTFRHDGLGNLRSLAIEMSTQVAMLRYLDNNRNRNTSPNQNFARELLELFLLGVGNYNEDDVEAATAAWTGHTDQWDTDAYVWRADWHDGSTKTFLGRTINQGGDPTVHGAETIEVVLGPGVVPADATVQSNRGRPTREVAAEFISRKLWWEFAGTDPSSAVIAAMRDAALANDFDIAPWVRTMLVHPEFYAPAVRQGLVRSPVEFVAAALCATGLRSADATPLWLMDGMGQRPLYPPNVSGWKHNGYWVNAAAMANRTRVARSMAWRTMTGYWEGDGLIHLADGTISYDEIRTTYGDQPVVVLDRILDLMNVTPSATSYAALEAYSIGSDWWERNDLVSLVLVTPDFHVA